MQTQCPTKAQSALPLPKRFDVESEKQFLLLPRSDEPGLAVTSILTRGLRLPLRTAACTSEATYPEELVRYAISQEHWQRFTQMMCDEAYLSRQQWTTVIGDGPDILSLGGVMIGILGAIRAFFVTRTARTRQEQRSLFTSMAGSGCEGLSNLISLWNESFFRPKGIVIRVDLLDDPSNGVENTQIHEKVSAILSDVEAKEQAAIKARVVIIPLKV